MRVATARRRGTETAPRLLFHRTLLASRRAIASKSTNRKLRCSCATIRNAVLYSLLFALQDACAGVARALLPPSLPLLLTWI